MAKRVYFNGVYLGEAQGEIPSLFWSDLKDDVEDIHALAWRNTRRAYWRGVATGFAIGTAAAGIVIALAEIIR